VLVQSQTLRCSGEHPGERSLARAQRLKAKVISVELDQVEDALVIPSVADAIERREPVLTTCHGLAVNDAGLQAQPNRRLDDKRKAPGQVIARPAVQFHPLAGLASDNPEAIVLDFVQPDGARRRLRG
jgi:hypothetical protein